MSGPVLLYCADSGNLETLRQGKAVVGEALRLVNRPEHARALCEKATVLAVDPGALDPPLPVEPTLDRLEYDVRRLPAGAVLNLNPEYRVRAVDAAGGYVVRHTEDGIEVLLILRNGVWDVPKGKLERRESPETGALREVREEVGVRHLDLVRPLGVTVHHYVRKAFFCVKTTHWYEMRTRDQTFTPQLEEGIEEVAWVSWEDASERLGYESLRRHMARIEMRSSNKG